MRAYHLLHALWVVLAIAGPVKRETFETYSVKARDLQNSVDTTLHTRQLPHSGAPSSAGARKNSKRADISSTVRNLWRNIKVGRRDISRRSPITADQLAVEAEKDLFVTMIHSIVYHFLPLLKPYGESSKPEAPPAPAPQSVAPEGDGSVSLASDPSDIFKLTPEAGSSLSNVCSGYQCFANSFDLPPNEALAIAEASH